MNMDVYVILKALVEAQVVALTALKEMRLVFRVIDLDVPLDKKAMFPSYLQPMFDCIADVERCLPRLAECKEMLDQVGDK